VEEREKLVIFFRILFGLAVIFVGMLMIISLIYFLLSIFLHPIF